MRTLTCIIVDDEPLAVHLLETYVEKTPDLQLVASFTDSITAINTIKAQKPDLLFLDIQMPNIDGMELAHSLPEETRIVFTTAFKEYAFESYEVNTLDFLLKPIRYNKFLAAVEKARKQYQQPFTQPQRPNTIFIRVDGEWRNVPIDQITYINGMKDYVLFYLDNEPKALITHLTMKSVEDMLPGISSCASIVLTSLPLTRFRKLITMTASISARKSSISLTAIYRLSASFSKAAQ